jgi:hypothetical protein
MGAGVRGFEPLLGIEAVPPSWVHTRLFRKLVAHQADVDSKGVDSHGKPTGETKPDGRRDMDADWGTKTYSGVRADGTAWEKIKRWFGYKSHLIIDAVSELPLGYMVTKASANGGPHPLSLVEKL